METQQMSMPPETAAPDQMAIFEQMRQDISPQEFTNEMLAGGSQVDPQAVAEFTKELEGLDMPPETLDALNDVVDDILASPEQYDEKRAQYVADGLPEDILPEQFDPEFFAALNMAIDQMIAAPTGVQAFAKGGIAELKPIAKAIASYGRNGDTMLAHITPAEARMLRRRGGSGTINPDTGLPEFFLKKLWRAVTAPLRSVAKAVKKFVSSKIGRIIATVALGFFLGPAAASMLGVSSAAGVAAVSGFVGSAGSTLLAGGNLKDALKAGAIGGITAGAGAGLMGGADAFASGSYTGPTTIGGQVDKFKNAVGLGGAPGGQLAPVVDAPASVPGTFGQDPTAAIGPGTASTPSSAVDFGAMPPPPAMGANTASVAAPELGVPAASPVTSAPLAAPAAPSYDPANMAAASPADFGARSPSMMDTAKQFYNEKLSPAGIKAAGQADAIRAGTDAVAKLPPGTSQGVQDMVFKKAFDAASPGVLSTYGPMAAAGLGIMGLTGGFQAKQPGMSDSARDLMDRDAGRVKIEDRPDLFYPQNLPGVIYDEKGNITGSKPWSPTATMDDIRVAAPGQQAGIGSLAPGGGQGTMYNVPGGAIGQSPQVYQPYNTASMYSNLYPTVPRAFADGGGVSGMNGIAGLAQGGYPRRTGQISGPGTEKSDSIPAMLSDGEFVMTAAAVKGAGNGSRRAGAKKMYALMHQLERNASRG
jgi:hypothetical protein